MISPSFKLSSSMFSASYGHRTTASVRERLGRRKREEAGGGKDAWGQEGEGVA